jgi:hypothetical protein
MTLQQWNVVYAKLHAENERQIRYYRALTWILPLLCLTIAAILWLLPFDEIRPLAYIVASASVIVGILNGWVWLRHIIRPMMIVEGTVAKKFAERDGQKGSTTKHYFLRIKPATMFELTPQGQGTRLSERKTMKIRCSKELSSEMLLGSTARLCVLPGRFAIGFIKDDEAVFPLYAVSFEQRILSTFLHVRQEQIS